MNEFDDTGNSEKTKTCGKARAHCEACGALLDGEQKAGLFRLAHQHGCATFRTRALLICPSCHQEADEERPEFWQRAAVAALETEARLLPLLVPREFWSRFQ